MIVHEGQVIAGKYCLTEPLAQGGMGSVWVAQHLTLGVPVAVKFMEPDCARDPQFRTRFKREAKAAAQLRSPNVVQILDYGVEGTTPYLVMELLQGEDLGEKLARERRLSVNDALPILAQIGKALRRAHEEGIVHRDLKPANVFLVPHDDELVVKVLDFGIAKWLQSDSEGETTKTGTLMGSPNYMSPEQVRGAKTIDHRADLWALGVIVYRMLTGHLPFPGANQGDIFVKICYERPIAPTVHVPELDPSVDAFMAKALSVDVEQRFQSVKEMLDAFAQLTAYPTVFAPAAGETSEPPDPTTTPYQPEQKAKKNRGVWIGAAVVLCVVIVALFVVMAKGFAAPTVPFVMRMEVPNLTRVEPVKVEPPVPSAFVVPPKDIDEKKTEKRTAPAPTTIPRKPAPAPAPTLVKSAPAPGPTPAPSATESTPPTPQAPTKAIDADYTN